ncbi:fatty acid desaturase [Thermosynechococcaceae cyanobacterium BACA0444]|uniref:Fatty acid desaturase n=1 Tax=Pseudocalidococcus azoricus BACA0444 TaxID=2918990 RepID=A0AAE4JVR9_9CYAN|nr:fatty acid desaturase [Pseudocalidococcus azoricus]MDS3860351.1 fatty acid desaturase [Pseudocalidococcus azoricus BACA0444]
MKDGGSSTLISREFLGPPGDFNPTVVMFIAAISLAVISTVGHFEWDWPAWCTFGVNILALHLVGTVIHDASHNVAHRNPLVNAVLGHGSALMLGFVFPVFTRVHIQHHAHVNDPENDPDHYVSKGGPLWLIAPRFFYHEIFFFKRRLWRNHELWEWAISRGLLVTVVTLAAIHGHLDYVLNFWFSPAGVVGLMLGLFFDYFPHRPHVERNRWHNARVYPSPILNFLILGQNYHLIHHLWPSIPWYKVQPAYYSVKPLLDAKGCKQTLGIFEPGNVGPFLYDALIGIHWPHSTSLPSHTQLNISVPESHPEPQRSSVKL